MYVYAMALSPLGDSFVKMNVTFHREYTEGKFAIYLLICKTEYSLFKVSYPIGQ